MKPIKQFNIFGGIDLVKPAEPKPPPEDKKPSSYTQYGLDEKKESADKGVILKQLYDPWLFSSFPVTEPHVYLCFSNFAISLRTIQVLVQQEPVESLPGECGACFKCRQQVSTLHYHVPGAVPWFEGGTNSIGICPECLQWASDYLARRADQQAEAAAAPPPPGTQMGIF